MPIQRDITFSSGLTCGYWGCIDIKLNPRVGEVTFVYAPFLNKEAYFSGAHTPVDQTKTFVLRIKKAGEQWTELSKLGLTQEKIMQLIDIIAMQKGAACNAPFADGKIVDVGDISELLQILNG